MKKDILCAAHVKNIKITGQDAADLRVNELEKMVDDSSHEIVARNTSQDDKFLKILKSSCFLIMAGFIASLVVLLRSLKGKVLGSSIRILLIGVIILGCITNVQAGTVRLKNGDALTGEIVSETEKSIFIVHEVLGTIEVKKEFMAVPENKEKESPQNARRGYEWQRKLSAGYSQSGGNTEVSRGVLGLGVTGKFERDEWTGKINGEYSASQQKMNARRFYSLIRHAHSFEENKKWYYSQKIEGDQDRFANIDYRLVPSLGLGYWFADTDSWKMMSEVSVGYEYTHFRDNAEDSGEIRLIPRVFLERALIRNLSFNQEFVLYPSLRNPGGYRFRSQTGLINKINQHCDLAVRFLDEYNSMPSGAALKNDYRLISSIDFLF